MRGRFRLPMVVVAVALLGLIALLATLQYRWVGRISDAEREHMHATLNSRASAFAQDFDGELTRAYLLFQIDPRAGGSLGMRLALRYDRWQSTARYPRVLKDLYTIGPALDSGLRRFNPTTRTLESVAWPPSMEAIRDALSARRDSMTGAGGYVVRQVPPPLWDRIPALVIPTPMLFLGTPGRADVRMLPGLLYVVVLMDRDYITNDMLPALAQQHFRKTGDGFDYQLAVVSTADRAVVYHSSPTFVPRPDASVDAAVDLFQVRTRDFGSIVSEVRRFSSTFMAGPLGTTETSTTVSEQIVLPPDERALAVRDRSAPFSIVIEPNGATNAVGVTGEGAGRSSATVGIPRWRLLVEHPSGSLESAVNAVRRRNLIISSSILSVLGASIALLVLSTRRAQELARQQMEFVAAVSHELRTPLAVIRSAAENLADGVVRDDAQIRKYGDLVRNEGRRLTEMVEQILEFAGIDSGQRSFALRPVPIEALLHEVVESSRTVLDERQFAVQFDFPDRLPPALGDETALRRVFDNLIANAIKYGERGRWIGIRAAHVGRDVHVTIADRGIGIAPAEQSRIFEPFYRAPDVIAARIQGAGLGLSLVQRIVQAHGGRITVQSPPGAGSEFTVILPAASEEAVGRTVTPDVRGHGSHA